MKINFNFTLLLLIFILATNCTDNDSMELESEKSVELFKKNDTFRFNQNSDNNLDLSNISFSSISFDFSEKDAIIIEHNDDIIRRSLFINQLTELFEKTKKDDFSEKGYLGLDFNVSFLDNKYTIYPEKFVFENENQSTLERGGCPNGMTKHKTCYTASCIQETLEIYGEVMESGDSFSVHYGPFNVKICANPNLIQRADNYIAPPD